MDSEHGDTGGDLAWVVLTFWHLLLSQWGMMTIPLWTRLENRLYSRRGLGAVG